MRLLLVHCLHGVRFGLHFDWQRWQSLHLWRRSLSLIVLNVRIFSRMKNFCVLDLIVTQNSQNNSFIALHVVFSRSQLRLEQVEIYLVFAFSLALSIGISNYSTANLNRSFSGFTCAVLCASIFERLNRLLSLSERRLDSFAWLVCAWPLLSSAALPFFCFVLVLHIAASSLASCDELIEDSLLMQFYSIIAEKPQFYWLAV